MNPQTVKTKHNTQVLFSYRHLTKAERSPFPKDAKLFSSAKYAPGSSLQYSSIALMHVSVSLEYMHLTTRSRLFKSWIALSTIVLGKPNALSFG